MSSRTLLSGAPRVVNIGLASFALGSGTESYPDYRPFVQNATETRDGTLLGELRAVNFVKRLIAEGRMPRGSMKDLSLHLIADDSLMNELGAGSKLSPSPAITPSRCSRS